MISLASTPPLGTLGALAVIISVSTLSCSNTGGSDDPLNQAGSAGTSSSAGTASSNGGSAGAVSNAGGTTSSGGAGAGGMVGADAGSPGRPNIIVVMADDLGFSDLGAFGGEIHTPNIDGLAENGLRFTNFFNSSRCSPTRASLLTGQYPHNVNLGRNGRDLGLNGLTIAEALGEAGYATAMVGKWHLSRTPELQNGDHMAWLNHQLDPGVPFTPDVNTYPARRGFQRHWGVIWGVVDYFDPFSLVDGVDAVPNVPDDFYMTDGISDKTVEYINDFAQNDAPFFMYVAHTAPHWPLHAKPEDIAKYEGVYDAGWHAIRNARYQRQLEMGLFEAQNTPLPATQGNNWDGLTVQQREFLSNTMQTHAAMVDSVDQAVGKMVQALEANGQLDNTLIIFLADNGASAEIYLNSGFDRASETREGEPIVYCGGQAPCPYSQPGAETTWAYLGPSWANAANTPFRYWKIDSFRGGNTTPVIVHWPLGLKTQAGSITEQPGHVIDILPTILELAGVEYPASYKGRDLTALDGKSLLPILEGGVREPHAELYFEHEGGAAMIAGDYKIVRPRGNGAWELYNLGTDRTETTNLANLEPNNLADLTARWSAWYDALP